MKIAILGYSGAGKSTLARFVGDVYQIPCYHFDKIQFKENWQERDRDEAASLVKEVMLNDQWVIDGNYSAFDYDQRMADANKIVFLNFPRRICLVRALKRNVEFRNKVRDSMADGCIEKFDWDFLMWILVNGRSPKYRERIIDLKQKYPEKFIELKNQREVDRFKAQLENMK